MLSANLGSFLASGTTFFDATWQTFMMVSVAELFDKTFFVALILALRYSKLVVFVGCYSALLVHTVMAAAAGTFINEIADKPVIDFATVALYAIFAAMYYWDYRNADPDGDVMDGMEEAREDLGEYGATEMPAKGKGGVSSVKKSWTWGFLGATFFTTWMAEMGDRTQIAMIGQAAVQPVLAMMLGSAVAFFNLTAIAILTGSALSDQGLKERTILLTGSASFAFFALITLKDGLDDIGFFGATPVAA